MLIVEMFLDGMCTQVVRVVELSSRPSQYWQYQELQIVEVFLIDMLIQVGPRRKPIVTQFTVFAKPGVNIIEMKLQWTLGQTTTIGKMLLVEAKLQWTLGQTTTVGKVLKSR